MLFLLEIVLVALDSLSTRLYVVIAVKKVIIEVIFLYNRSIENIYVHLAALFSNRFSFYKLCSRG